MRLKPKQQQLPCEVKPVLKNVSLQLDCNSIVDILLRHLSPSIPCGLNSKTSSKYPQLYIHMKFNDPASKTLGNSSGCLCYSHNCYGRLLVTQNLKYYRFCFLVLDSKVETSFGSKATQ